MGAQDVLVKWLEEWGYGLCHIWQPDQKGSFLRKKGITISLVCDEAKISVQCKAENWIHIDLHDPDSKEQLWAVIDRFLSMHCPEMGVIYDGYLKDNSQDPRGTFLAGGN
jgi:hypothetical protein